MAATASIRAKRGAHENATIVLLLLGGLLWGVGWLVGVVLLWLSSAWTTRDKVIGTLVVPGGLGLPLFLALGVGTSTSESCANAVCTHSGGISTAGRVAFIAFVALLAVASIASAVYLAKRAHAPSAV